jgi:copper chaperone CopZ
VWGNCGMCNTKITTAAKSVVGVISAKWNSETKMMSVKYDSEKTNLDEIQKKIASVGYDTKKYKADDEVYNNLHHCCKYDRN